jgi:hypothetical protein
MGASGPGIIPEQAHRPAGQVDRRREVGGTAASTQRKKRNIRFHDQEWERVEARARACGLPPATYVRKASLGIKLRARRNRTENELIFHLGRIAMDLQRLAHAPDPVGSPPSQDELQMALEEVLAAVRRVG